MNDVTVARHALPAVDLLRKAALRGETAHADGAGWLRFGVDLGTATIVLCAVDEAGEPVYWAYRRVRAVRDGVVVEFEQAVRAVRDLARQTEAVLGTPVTAAATAHPPGVPASDCRACRHVLEQAGVDCRALVDEVSAAQAVLDVRDGAIVDVGGGSTGVGVFRGGALVSLSDLAGGGQHLDLILAGGLGISVEEAECRKRTEGGRYVALLAPGFERIAASVARQCGGEDPGVVHLAGGALRVPGAQEIVERYLGWKTIAYPHADLITPFGIALS